MQRYTNREGSIELEDFLVSASRLRIAFRKLLIFVTGNWLRVLKRPINSTRTFLSSTVARADTYETASKTPDQRAVVGMEEFVQTMIYSWGWSANRLRFSFQYFQSQIHSLSVRVLCVCVCFFQTWVSTGRLIWDFVLTPRSHASFHLRIRRWEYNIFFRLRINYSIQITSRHRNSPKVFSNKSFHSFSDCTKPWVSSLYMKLIVSLCGIIKLITPNYPIKHTYPNSRINIKLYLV